MKDSNFNCGSIPKMIIVWDTVYVYIIKLFSKLLVVEKQINRQRLAFRSIFLLCDYYHYSLPKGGLLITIVSPTLYYIKAEYNLNTKVNITTGTVLYIYTANKNFRTSHLSNNYICSSNACNSLKYLIIVIYDI